PGVATIKDAKRVHTDSYLDTFQKIDALIAEGKPARDEIYYEESPFVQHGFLSGDNPPFPSMWQATLNFIAGTVRAAEEVRDGAQMALTLGGGLHHCSKERASGFCLLDDPAIACAILREKFDRVAYVDIDL